MTLRSWIPWLALATLALSTPSLAEVPLAPESVRPLLVGSRVPDAELQTSDGEATTLHSAMGKGRSLILFYRGGW